MYFIQVIYTPNLGKDFSPLMEYAIFTWTYLTTSSNVIFSKLYNGFVIINIEEWMRQRGEVNRQWQSISPLETITKLAEKDSENVRVMSPTRRNEMCRQRTAGSKTNRNKRPYCCSLKYKNVHTIAFYLPFARILLNYIRLIVNKRLIHFPHTSELLAAVSNRLPDLREHPLVMNSIACRLY